MAPNDKVEQSQWKKLTQQEADAIVDVHEEFLKGTRGGERAK